MSSETASGNKVISLALNGNESLLIGLTDTLQLMCFSLAETQPVSAVKVKNEFSVFSYPFHHGSITGVDVCQRKPLGNHNASNFHTKSAKDCEPSKAVTF